MAKCVCILRNLYQLICEGIGKLCLSFKEIYFSLFVGVLAKCVCILRKKFQFICGGIDKMCLYFKKFISAYLWG